MRAVAALKHLRTHNDDQKTGVDIVRKALSCPARQIAINAGEDGSLIVGKILEKDQYGFGFDAQSGEYGNLVAKGIIDPTKVVRAALQDAASIAGLLITTEAMVAERPKKEGSGNAGRRLWGHGRNGLLIAPFILENKERPGGTLGPFENLTYKPSDFICSDRRCRRSAQQRQTGQRIDPHSILRQLHASSIARMHISCPATRKA